MELVCVLVLSLVTLVASSPYGYGVKGGAAAIAKADANSAAGAFPGVGALPLSIPSAGSYSGSYSKSSSSSYAASSATSSSSSFAYTGSGILPNSGGYGANGLPASTKCTTGNCPTGSSAPTGSGAFGYGGANAAAGAGAIVFPGAYGSHNTECAGSSCLNGAPSCNGGNCGNTSNTNNKCTSGQCGSTQATTSSGNDIYISTSGTKPYDKTTTPGSHNACTYGNCETSASSSSQKPSSPSFTDAHPSATAYVNKPSSTLVAPNEEIGCSSPGCSTTSSSYDVKKPSSYNVPSNTVYSQNKVPCTSGSCENDNDLNSPIYTSPTGSDSCTNGHCINSIQTSSVAPAKPTGTINSDYPDFVPLAPSGTPAKPVYSHNSPTNAPSVPSFTVSTGSQSSNYGPIKPLVPITSPEKSKLPYTGGFGGPPGILLPNEFKIPPKGPGSDYEPATTTGSSYKPVPSGSSTPIYSPVPSTTSCSSGNCGLESGSSYKPSALTNSYNPSSCIHGNCAEPGLILRPHDQSSSPSSFDNKPSLPVGINKPTTCISGNCGPAAGQSPPHGAGNSYNSHPGFTTTLAPASYQIGCSSGNCGNPSQTPNYHDNNSYKPSHSSGSYNPSEPISSHKPATPVCSSGNCGNQPSQQKPQQESHGIYNPSAPTRSYNTESFKPIQASPQYDQNGLYRPQAPAGAISPSGSYNPVACSSGNCAPQSTSNLGSSSYRPTISPNVPQHDFGSVSYNPTGPSGAPCSSGNCGSQSTSNFGSSSYKPTRPTGSYGISPNVPQYDSGSVSYHPTGPSGAPCPSGNCDSESTLETGFNKPQHVTSGNHYNPTGPSNSYGPTGCASGNCQSTGPSGSFNPSACSSGNCQQNVPQIVSQYKPTVTAPSGSFSSTGFSDTYGPTPCSSGNCGAHPAKPGIPSFGGPPGLLKPNEFTFVQGSASGQTDSVNPSNYKPVAPTTPVGGFSTAPTVAQSPSCLSGNCEVKPNQPSSHYGQNGAHVSQAVAGAAANAIAYTGGFGGPPGLLQPYDNGKLPSGVGSSGSQSTGNFGGAPNENIHSSYGKSLNGVNTGTVGNAQASAISGAAAGSYGGEKAHGDDNKQGSGGCNNGCNAASGSGHSGAAAKSVAQAVSSANAGGYSGSFASSTASAHASAGAATKGGYGKR